MIPLHAAPLTGGPAARFPVGMVGSRLAALLMALVALTGAVGWLVTLSPLQLERWQSIETQHVVTFDGPGTYLLFEEGPGADARRGEPRVLVSVRSIAGRPVPVRSLLDSRGRSPLTYDVRLHQGRVIAAIEVDRPGRYLVMSFSAAVDPAERRRPGAADLASMPGLAVGPEGEPSDWGTWRGLAVLGGLPALLAVALARWAGRAYPMAVGPVLESPRPSTG